MAVHIRRREFVFTLGGAAAGWPLAAGAQQPAMPVVAFINVGSLDTRRDRVDAFRKGLSETGYTERQNVSVEYHWLDGRYLRLPEVLEDVGNGQLRDLSLQAARHDERLEALRKSRCHQKLV